MTSQGPQRTRESPPHLPDGDGHGTGPNVSTGETAPFVSAASNLPASDPIHLNSAAPSFSSGERTAAPDAPTGLRAKIFRDDRGVRYAFHAESGMRIDLSDEEEVPYAAGYYRAETPPRSGRYLHPNAPQDTVPSRSTVSSTSDMQLTSQGSTLAPPTLAASQTPESVLDSLVEDLGVELTTAQRAKYSAIRGMLSTGRTHPGHRTAIEANATAIEEVRKITEVKLQQLHQTVSLQESQIEYALNENIRVLRSFGTTEDQLADLLKLLSEHTARSSPKPELAPLSRDGSRSITPLDEFQSELDSALPRRGADESHDAFFRRGNATVSRRERTATSFAVGRGGAGIVPTPLAQPGPFAKSARFEDPGSISTAHLRPSRGYSAAGVHPSYENGSAYVGPGSVAPIGSTFESFHHDQEKAIRRIAHREIGEPLNLPPYIKIPKTDSPPKYAGEDNLDVFLKFVELHCTWLRSQALCGYEPAIDKYRITMLKSHLAGDALDWLMQLLNDDDHADLTYTEILCALHQRFITSANAQRATQAFDAVKYDHVAGPDSFAEQLLKRANLMNHVPDEFAINRRFLSGLPQPIRFRLRVDRQMTAEYTPFAVLRTSARQLWGALNEDGSRDAAASARLLQPAARTPQPASSAPRRSATPAERVNPRPVTLPLSGKPAEETRTCYKCGVYGHIGSNPICPKYKENLPAPGARVGAQRVPESYSDAEEHFASDEQNIAQGNEPVGDEYEGLWGGAQYDPDADPNESPDLADLLHSGHGGHDGLGGQGEDEVRVGALRAQYYAIRIPEPSEPADESETPEEEVAVPVRIPNCDLPPSSSTPWTTACEHQLELAASAGTAPTSSGYEARLAEFETRVGSRTLSIAQTTELEAISAIGAEEQARAVWRALIPLHPPLRIDYSPEYLRTTSLNLVAESLLFVPELAALRQYQQDLVDLLARRLAARDEIARLSALPTGASSQLGEYLADASAINHRLSLDIHHHVEHVDYWVHLVSDSHRNVNAELVRRMFAREAHALEMVHGTSSSPDPHSAGINPPAAAVDDAGLIASPAALAGVETPPPSIGSTPPPSYPGTPESQGVSSGSEGLWDEQDDPSAVLEGVIFLPGDAPVMISDSEDESSPSLRANRIITGATGPDGIVEALLDIRVPDTYEDDAEPASPRNEVDGVVESPLDIRVLETYEDESEPNPRRDEVDGHPDADRDPIDDEPPRLISRAICRMGDISTEQVLTYLRADGTVYIEYTPLPRYHYLSDSFRDDHEVAMGIAIAERAAELGVPRDEVRWMVTLDAQADVSLGSPVLWHRHGFLDTEPFILPGTNFHDRVASLGPEDDDESALPGFRVQVLAQQVPVPPRVEHISNVRRPEKTVGLFDQPK
ncbi:hypothetical protein DFH06DRAFT_1130351 [Mycena polygramma]|nr:hypothetical protein DFH06DRAFT_1130351 [Mycena polygramma]